MRTASREMTAPRKGGTSAGLAGRLELLEALLSQDDVAGCAQVAVEWLGRHAGATRALLALADAKQGALVGVAGLRVSTARVEQFSVPLDHRRHPLVWALNSRTAIRLRAGIETDATAPEVATTVGDEDALAWPIGLRREVQPRALGVLLVTPVLAPTRDDLQVFWEVVGRRLGEFVVRDTLADAERRFRHERSLLHTIFNAVTDPVLLTDTEGRLIIANASADTLFAGSEEMSEGRRRAVELNNMFFSAALSSTAMESSRPRREVLLVDPLDGSDLLFELMSSVVDDPREGTGVVSILRNVTDLRRAAEEIEQNYARLRLAEAEVRAERDRLDVIIDSVADPILVTDGEGKISLMNAPAERLFMPNPVGGVVAESAQRAVQSNDAHFSSFIAGLLSTGGEMRRHGELLLVDPVSADALPVEAISGKVLSKYGEFSAVVTILHDRREAIDRARLYEQLKRSSLELEARVQAATAELAEQNELLRRQAIELEQASAAKSQFLAKMSHELRTPLNAIIGYAQILDEGLFGELGPDQRSNLNRIQSNSRHLLAVISEILDITRIEAGHMPVQPSGFRLDDLLDEVTTELEPIIVRSKLRVTTTLAPSLPPLWSDRQKVKQIVVNLLGNALKFTHAGEVRISAAGTGGMIAISVADTGIGIAPTDYDRIFEDFQQVDSTTTRAYGGTGLGLSICRRLASMLGGSIRVESAVGRGSTFTVALPATLATDRAAVEARS